MKKRVSKLLCATALSVSVFAAPAMAQEAWSDWDADSDSILSEDEFGTGFGGTGVYDTWDADDDGLLSEDEFTAGIYDSYDDDDSGVIEEPELDDLGDDMGDGGFWDV